MSGRVAFEIEMENRMPKNNIHIKDARLHGAIWCKGSKEITTDQVNRIVITPAEREALSAVSRGNSGMSGEFNLYDGDTKICNVYWMIAYGAQPVRVFQIRNFDSETSPYCINNRGTGDTVTILVSLKE